MKVVKRDGRIVDFEPKRIVDAINKAMAETLDGVDSSLSQQIADSIAGKVAENGGRMDVENIQDLVEAALMASHRKDAAKKYILYRRDRARQRARRWENGLLKDDFLSKYKHRPSNMKPLGEFVYYRTYSRWLDDSKRREYWWETVRRAVEYNCRLVDGVTAEEAEKLYDNIYNLRQFLSGRTLWLGGTEIAEQYGTGNYNCAFCIIDSFEKFSELFYLLMIGTGVGFRILKSDVEKMPPVRTNAQVIHEYYNPLPPKERQDYTSLVFDRNIAKITVGDSKEGWTKALEFFFSILYSHSYQMVHTIILNYDNVRPRGERLKRFGGTASGHESLKTMFEKITEVISRLGHEENKIRCKLRPIHCLDICNIIGENVVVGGVRRTAEVGIIGADDEECIRAKSELYYLNDRKEWVENKSISHRKMSNNSIFYEERPSREQLRWQLKQMRQSGEPGFINAEAARRRRADFQGINPCAEILLRDRGLCNLTTVNVAAFVDENGQLDLERLTEAQRLSVRAGIRMTCVDLELYQWDTVQKEDRLLGVSLTGWQDAMSMLGYSTEQEEELLKLLRKTAHEEAAKYSAELKIPAPKLICTIKPEGTLSLLPGVSSGLHHSHSPYYIRRIRINAGDPLVKVCEALGYPVLPENGQNPMTCSVKVVEFPQRSPVKRTKYDVSALEQLETYKRFMRYYVDHNASITVTVKSDEWNAVEDWLYENWDEVVAVSFLALDDSFYPLLPYESISAEEYRRRISAMKPFIPSLLAEYEKEKFEADIQDTGCENGICPVR
ncbi:MAG: ribonucleoside-triphosphate reductase, adenosylcobalamin-dependent [Bacillota bacterium]